MQNFDYKLTAFVLSSFPNSLLTKTNRRNLLLWEDGQEQVALNEIIWTRLLYHFNIVILEYIKHGELNKILFIDYIRVAKILFEKVKLMKKFRDVTRIQFPTSLFH